MANYKSIMEASVSVVNLTSILENACTSTISEFIDIVDCIWIFCLAK